MSDDKLVELPEPAIEVDGVYGYTDDQMRAYGEACALAQSAASGNGEECCRGVRTALREATDRLGATVLEAGHWKREAQRISDAPYVELLKSPTGQLYWQTSIPPLTMPLGRYSFSLAAGRDGVGGGSDG